MLNTMPVKCGLCTPVSAAAEALHRGFLKHLLGVSMSTANETVLAEVGHLPSRFTSPSLAADFALLP